MKVMHLLLAAAVTAAAAAPVRAQDMPNLVPLPSAPAVPPRSDKILVTPSDAPVRPAIPAAAGEKLERLGSQGADAGMSAQAREMLVGLVNGATRENGFVEVIGFLAQQDRERVGDVRRLDLDDLHKAISRFRDDFRQKYHQEFALRPEHLQDAQVNRGADDKALTVVLSELEKNPAVKPIDDKNAPSSLKPADGASANIPAHTGMSMVSGPVLNLINEGAAGGNSKSAQWKVNIPNEISAKQLKENLTLHLQKLDEQKSAWSDDANVTSRAAAAQVLQALNDATLASDH